MNRLRNPGWGFVCLFGLVTQGSCYAATLGYPIQPLCGWDVLVLANHPASHVSPPLTTRLA